MKKIWLGLAGLTLLGACSKGEISSPQPCDEYSLYDCTETRTAAPLDVQTERLQRWIFNLREEVRELQSLPTAKKEKEAKDKAEATRMGFITKYSATSMGLSSTVTVYPK